MTIIKANVALQAKMGIKHLREQEQTDFFIRGALLPMLMYTLNKYVRNYVITYLSTTMLLLLL